MPQGTLPRLSVLVKSVKYSEDSVKVFEGKDTTYIHNGQIIVDTVEFNIKDDAGMYLKSTASIRVNTPFVPRLYYGASSYAEIVKIRLESGENDVLAVMIQPYPY